MEKYISADKLLNEFLTYPSLWVSYEIKGRNDKDIENLVADVLRQAKETIVREINEQEIADVRENIHGEWIPMTVSSGRNSWQCSECGRRARVKKENLPFCHCGADMRDK